MSESHFFKHTSRFLPIVNRQLRLVYMISLFGHFYLLWIFQYHSSLLLNSKNHQTSLTTNSWKLLESIYNCSGMTLTNDKEQWCTMHDWEMCWAHLRIKKERVVKRFGCAWRVVNEVSSQSNDPNLWFKILDSQTLMVRHHINFPWLMFKYKQDLG